MQQRQYHGQYLVDSERNKTLTTTRSEPQRTSHRFIGQNLLDLLTIRLRSTSWISVSEAELCSRVVHFVPLDNENCSYYDNSLLILKESTLYQFERTQELY